MSNVTWGRIRDLHARHKWLGTCQRTRWEIAPGQEALGISTDNPEAFQGLHSANLLVVADEASGQRIDQLFPAIESLTSTSGAKILLVGNPTRRAGIFAEAARGGHGFTVVRMDGEDCVAW